MKYHAYTPAAVNATPFDVIVNPPVVVAETKTCAPDTAKFIVSLFAGVRMTTGAAVKAELNDTVAIVASVAGAVPAVNVILPALSNPVIANVGDPPAPVSAAIVGALPPTLA
jgi:hypothetical protein